MAITPRQQTAESRAALVVAALAAADSQQPAAMQLYRVMGDWYGGGFGYTLPFPSAEAAQAWGEAKARFHRDAVIRVVHRGPARAADDGVEFADPLEALRRVGAL